MQSVPKNKNFLNSFTYFRLGCVVPPLEKLISFCPFAGCLRGFPRHHQATSQKGFLILLVMEFYKNALLVVVSLLLLFGLICVIWEMVGDGVKNLFNREKETPASFRETCEKLRIKAIAEGERFVIERLKFTLERSARLFPTSMHEHFICKPHLAHLVVEWLSGWTITDTPMKLPIQATEILQNLKYK